MRVDLLHELVLRIVRLLRRNTKMPQGIDAKESLNAAFAHGTRFMLSILDLGRNV